MQTQQPCHRTVPTSVRAPLLDKLLDLVVQLEDGLAVPLNGIRNVLALLRLRGKGRVASSLGRGQQMVGSDRRRQAGIGDKRGS